MAENWDPPDCILSTDNMFSEAGLQVAASKYIPYNLENCVQKGYLHK